MSSVVSIDFKKINSVSQETIAVVGINRPEAANAFNEEMITGLKQAFVEVDLKQGCRAMVLRGHGKHFSAGADLKWMQNSANMSLEDNLKSAENMQEMFEALNRMSKPTLCLIKGAAYGGAVGLAAAADVCLSYESARYCLSEVRLGILPAVIFPYLARKIKAGQLRRLSLSAKVFSGREAVGYGLAQDSVTDQSVDEKIREELNGFLEGGPKAQGTLKELLSKLEIDPKQSEETVRAIAETRIGDEAQSGFRAFFAKEETPWKLTLPVDWKIDD